ncbi:aminotransferase class V-fold PLP-dependent enzyme [Gynuella sunshinyii]|nr:cysteine desulfurase [Gynuella sunshinyii]
MTRKRMFNVDEVRADFPILEQQVNGQPLVYLDNAATTQKPNQVIDALSDYYRCDNANVHRGAHTLSDRSTHKFEAAREKVRDFIRAAHSHEIIWTKGTTESINLVAYCYGSMVLEEGDTVLVSAMEHHSNIVPWQLVAARKNAQVLPIPVSDKGEMAIETLETMLQQHSVKMVAIAHVSNALGTINPIREVIDLAHRHGAKVLVDGAQGISHWPVDVQKLDVDFYAFSGHKMFAPTGIGVLYGKEELLNAMPPFLGGGEMIETVSFAGTTFNQLPFKFEAGTPNIADVIGLGAAIDYLEQFDRQQLIDHELDILNYAFKRAEECQGINVVGQAQHRAGVLSFNLQGAHPSDVGMLLDQQGVAVRTGHHCAQPIMAQLGIPGTVRASFSIYNHRQDIDRLFAALEKVKQFL